MTNSRAIGGLVVSLAMLAGVAQAWAAEPDSSARAEAKERLDHGLYFMENGAYAAALGEFEKAQELAPSRLLLYHIALAYVAMDKPVDALESLDEVLSADGTLKSEYVERAKTAKEEQLLKIGELDVKVNVPAAVKAEGESGGEAPPPPQVKAAIEIDGERVGETPRAAPLKVAAGEHAIAVIAPGYVPVRQTFAVAAQGRAELTFDLKATEAKLAHVTVKSPLPGAEVRVDEALVGKTPLADPVVVLPGERTFELQRPGYMAAHRTLKLRDGVYSGIAFDPDEEESGGAPRGQLRLKTGVEGVAVTIDGRARGVYREPIDLPAGPHTLKLERKGYESLERMVDVPGGDETEVKVSLRATDKTREAAEARVRSRRFAGLATLVLGAVVAGAGTGVAVWQNGLLPAAEDKLAIAKQDALATCPPGDPDIPPLRQKICDEKIADAQSEIDSHRTWRLGRLRGRGRGRGRGGHGDRAARDRPLRGARRRGSKRGQHPGTGRRRRSRRRQLRPARTVLSSYLAREARLRDHRRPAWSVWPSLAGWRCWAGTSCSSKRRRPPASTPARATPRSCTRASTTRPARSRRGCASRGGGCWRPTAPSGAWPGAASASWWWRCATRRSPKLERHRAQADANGVEGIAWLERDEVARLEPAVTCARALSSRATGLVDSHGLMRALADDARRAGADLVVSSPVVGGEIAGHGIDLDVGGREPGRFRFATVVNAAGFSAPAVARSLGGLDGATVPPAYFARGHYFTVSGVSPFRRLIYPLPSRDGLGIHVALDLGGNLRFGPGRDLLARAELRLRREPRRLLLPGDSQLLPGPCRRCPAARLRRGTAQAGARGQRLRRFRRAGPRTARRGRPAQPLRHRFPRPHLLPGPRRGSCPSKPMSTSWSWSWPWPWS